MTGDSSWNQESEIFYWRILLLKKSEEIHNQDIKEQKKQKSSRWSRTYYVAWAKQCGGSLFQGLLVAGGDHYREAAQHNSLNFYL